MVHRLPAERETDAVLSLQTKGTVHERPEALDGMVEVHFFLRRTHARTHAPPRAHTNAAQAPTHAHTRTRAPVLAIAGLAGVNCWRRRRQAVGQAAPQSRTLFHICLYPAAFLFANLESVRGVRQRRPHRVLFLQVHFFDVYDYLNAIDELRKTGIHFSERKPGIKWPAHGVGGTMGNDDGLSQGTSVSDDQGADLRRCAHEN